MEHADEFVKLPMYGFTESYNISVSVAIALFSATQNMREQSSDWQLSEEEQVLLKLDWAKKVVKKSALVEKILNERYVK